MEAIYVIIGQKVRKYREKEGITQDQLAESTKVNRTSIVNLESGKQRIQIRDLYAIAIALGYPIMDFLPAATPDVLDDVEDMFQKFMKHLQDM